MPDYIRKFLDISTGHLTEETRQRLEQDDIFVSCTPHPFGWWVYACDDEGILEEHFPEDLANICRFAREHGCSWINLDRDADEIDELYYFEDDLQ